MQNLYDLLTVVKLFDPGISSSSFNNCVVPSIKNGQINAELKLDLSKSFK